MVLAHRKLALPEPPTAAKPRAVRGAVRENRAGEAEALWVTPLVEAYLSRLRRHARHASRRRRGTPEP